MSIPSVGDVIAAFFGERQADPGLVVYGPCCRAEPGAGTGGRTVSQPVPQLQPEPEDQPVPYTLTAEAEALLDAEPAAGAEPEPEAEP